MNLNKHNYYTMDKFIYVEPEMVIEDCLPDQMLCNSLVGGLEDTIDDPIY